MPLPTNISEATRRLNPHLFGGAAAAPIMRDATKNAHTRIRQKTGPKLNKTEAAFQSYLAGMYPEAKIRAQEVTIVLCNGVRYTPDFFDLQNLRAWETKGFMRDDAAVKIKMAASVYPEVKFSLVTKVNGGGWQIDEVFP